jgi:hypothetical protein
VRPRAGLDDMHKSKFLPTDCFAIPTALSRLSLMFNNSYYLRGWLSGIASALYSGGVQFAEPRTWSSPVPPGECQNSVSDQDRIHPNPFQSSYFSTLLQSAILNRTIWLLLDSVHDGDTSSLLNVVVFCLPHTRRWTESKRSQIVLYNMHHRQNPFKSICRTEVKKCKAAPVLN